MKSIMHRYEFSEDKRVGFIIHAYIIAGMVCGSIVLAAWLSH